MAKTMQASSVPATKPSTALAGAQSPFYAEDAGAGMEGADKDAFAIPFLGVLQKGSPQVDEASGAAIDGAKAGMLFENVNSRLIDGKAGARLVFCSYKRVFVQWAGREGANGASFKGEHTPEAIAAMRERGQVVELEGRLYAPLPDGSVSEKRSDRFADTRNHYVLLLGEDGSWQEALLSLASTQIKKSKNIMSALASVKLQGPNGLYTPPTFASVVRATTVPESNDKGTWFGLKLSIEGRVESADVYAAARAFHKTASAGPVEAKYEASSTAAPEADGRF